MEAFLTATGVVALAEIGDKTQLLAFVLAARFRRPGPIILGILVATLVNHGLAGGLGVWIASLLAPGVLGWVIGVSFVAIAVWILVPDELDQEGMRVADLGLFNTTVLAFFLAEMGDKTQIATVALAARYPALVAVVAGTTAGMLIANIPAVYLGKRTGSFGLVRVVRVVAAAVFVLLGIAAILGADSILDS